LGTVNPGDSIKVSANLLDSEGGVSGANVTAKVETPMNTTEEIVLYDDGMHDDGIANDGLYANYYNNTYSEGSYNFTVRATGEINGEKFSRGTNIKHATVFQTIT